MAAINEQEGLSMCELQAKYYWKKLTSDGLLKEPNDVGSYYDSVSLNGSWSSGFESEEEAVARLQKLKAMYEYELTGDYVLVKVYG